ncbi:MAG: hypothetical protein PXZ07_03140 [Candidatus Eremiobacteraeota bacterium]|nr:hypothetical protein [Candidatus Eremiobacteraeota bacterium]
MFLEEPSAGSSVDIVEFDLMINYQGSPPPTMYISGKPFVLAQQSACQRIPMQRHNQFPGNNSSKAAEIANGLIVSLNSVVIGFIYIRNDGTVIYEDGFVHGPSVPKGPHKKVFQALRVRSPNPAGEGELIKLKTDPFLALLRAGFGLTSCY